MFALLCDTTFNKRCFVVYFIHAHVNIRLSYNKKEISNAFSVNVMLSATIDIYDMGTTAYLFKKNKYDQMTQEGVFCYAFIRQVHPDAVSY